MHARGTGSAGRRPRRVEATPTRVSRSPQAADHRRRFAAIRLAGVLLAGLFAATQAAAAQVPVYGYKVVQTFPHDTGAYTQGLLWHEGELYEGTGQVGRSSIRRVDLETGEVLQRRNLMPPHFGEGIVIFGDKLYQLTWRSGVGFIYDRRSFEELGQFRYRGEGWGLTADAESIYMSDGTPEIRVLEPETMRELRRIRVTLDGRPVGRINELEWIRGELWANIFMTLRIVRINPESGAITGIVDLGGLEPKPGELRDPYDEVANGIAFDAAGDRIFVTGKDWPRLYQIELTEPATP